MVGLNNRNLLFHGSGDLKYKIKVSAGMVPSEDSLFGLQMPTFLLYHFLVSSCHKNTGCWMRAHANGFILT